MAQDRKVTVLTVGSKGKAQPVTQPARQTDNARKQFGTKK
jgi:hypothetical protein